jgi:hypothetical protein
MRGHRGKRSIEGKLPYFFSKNTRQAFRNHISAIVGSPSVQSYEKYLGLPALVGRNKRQAFSSIQGRVRNKLHGWKEKFLSQSGKEVLIKAVVQAIPTYSMNIFQLPKTLCQELNSIMCQFYWGQKDNGSRTIWMSWMKMGRSKAKGGLGFRDLECFNLAMLAKQGWRLLQFPESLAARILKEKYHPHCSFLEANLGHCPSYAWRSICKSRGLLNEGLFWRVGNGVSIKIWQDRWLPCPTTFRIQSPRQLLGAEATVAALIDADTRWWKTSLIQSIFLPSEAAHICSIALSPGNQPDKLIWRGNSSGLFSVRSAYHLEKERRSRDSGESSSASISSETWRRIWNLKVPGVVRNFIWRMCHNLLPTKVNLFQRKIVPDTLCPMCGIEPETSGHIIWNCDSSKAVWMECGRRIQKLSLATDDGLGLFESWMGKLEQEELNFVSCMARRIWLRRNSVVFGGLISPPGLLVQSTKESLEAYHHVRKLPGLGTTTRPARSRWKKPPAGVLKVNWDAALDQSSNSMGVGVIALDEWGSVVASMCDIIPFITDPTIAEAVAASKAVVFCSEQCFQRIILEGDALEIVQGLRQEGPSWQRYGHLLEDSRARLNGLQFWQLNHVRRDANEVAHGLAKFALQQSHKLVWSGTCPNVVQASVLAEQAEF